MLRLIVLKSLPACMQLRSLEIIGLCAYTVLLMERAKPLNLILRIYLPSSSTTQLFCIQINEYCKDSCNQCAHPSNLVSVMHMNNTVTLIAHSVAQIPVTPTNNYLWNVNS